MIIVGAGMSGLLAGALNPGSIIYEAGPERESDHKALFRCKSDQIGKTLGIPFKKVNIYKSIWLDNTEVHVTPRISHMYSQKVAGKISGRSITDIESGFRYIPPNDFIKQLKSRCKIKYNFKFNYGDCMAYEFPIISTIPMPNILDMLPEISLNINFNSKPIFVNRIIIPNCNAYCTVYYPDPEMNTYRASITRNTLITEGIDKLSATELNEICNSFGIYFSRQMMNAVKNHTQKMGKITPIDNKLREKIITDLTINYGIYSLGRFATWRPKVVLDDVLEDIWHIRRLIEGGNYASLKHRQNEEK